MRKMLTNGRFVLVLVVLTAVGVLVTRELAGQSRNAVRRRTSKSIRCGPSRCRIIGYSGRRSVSRSTSGITSGSSTADPRRSATTRRGWN